MGLSHAFILCAGYGTRMGEIGKILPKLMWPIFEKKMLEAQVLYARSLGCRRIFINSHYLHEQIQSFVSKKNWDDVILVHEPVLLDMGGGICNVATYPELQDVEQLLILNGDQFYLFDHSFLEEASKELGDSKALLFGIKVPANSGYNATIVKDGRLVAIEAGNGKAEDYLTYSGVGLINLKRLNKIAGPSRFFDTIAPYKTDSVLMRTPGDCEYWDFGTISRYHQSMFRLMSDATENPRGKFVSFCKQEGILNFKKISRDKNAYGQERWKNTIKLGEGEILNYEAVQAICLGDEGGVSVEGNGIYFSGIFDPLV